jgi:uncharacterized delta-60 repeat protein
VKSPRQPAGHSRARTRAVSEPLESRRLLSAGDLDPLFGTGGKALFDSPASANDQAKSVVVQPDGKYVVAGTVRSTSYSLDAAFGLARYNPDGSLDPTFGRSGKVLVPVGRQAVAYSLALEQGGKIIVAGTTSTTVDYDYGDNDLAVVRLNPDGSADSGFDGDGTLVIAFDGRTIGTPAAAVAPDGTIVVVSTAYGPSSATLPATALVRLKPDGSFDAGFDGDGKLLNTGLIDGACSVSLDDQQRILVGGSQGSQLAIARFTATGAADVTFDADGVATAPFFERGALARSVAIMPDGRIVAAGGADLATGQANSQYDVALARFNSNGTLDPSFSGDGKATIGIPDRRDSAAGVAVSADGAVAAVALSYGPDYRAALYRVDATGAADANFDGDGILLFGSSWSGANAVVLSADGSVMAAGYDGPGYEAADFLLARFTSTGAPDPTFNGTGAATTDFVAMGRDAAVAVAVQPDGKPVVAGLITKPDHSGSTSIVKRYNADGTPDASFGVGGVVRDVNAAALALQSDGKILAASSAYNTAHQHSDWQVTRLNPDGSPDITFGQGGSAVVEFPNGGQARAIMVQPDGRILVAGSSYADYATARLLATGALDPSFGIGGKVTTSVGGPMPLGLDGVVTSIALAPGGKIVVAGPILVDYGRAGEFGVVRYDSAGRPDPTFGRGGLDSLYVRGSDDDIAVVVLSDGSMVVGTTTGANSADRDFAIFPIPEDGQPYPWDEVPGLIRVDFGGGHDELHDLLLLPDGRVLAIGSGASAPGGEARTELAIARLFPGSGLDPSFGNGGKVLTDVAGSIDDAIGAAVSPMGRVVVAGTAVVPTHATDIVVARYLLSDGSPLPRVVDARVFYNHSAPGRTYPSDKQPLLAGQKATFANITTNTRGINGVTVEVMNPYGVALSADDFVFRQAPGKSRSAWTEGPRPASVTVQRGRGDEQSDRITLIWNDYDPRSGAPDQAVANGWLEVTVRPDGPRLAAAYVFRIGNLIGETGDAPPTDVVGSAARVDARDVIRTVSARRGYSDEFDFDRDGRVDVLDVAAVRANFGQQLATPQDPPAPPAPAESLPLRKRRTAYLAPLF